MNLEIARLVRQLAQSRPSGTGAASIIAKADGKKVIITGIIVSNTTTGNATYSIYLDNDGTTYDQTTSLFYGVLLTANATDVVEFANGLPIDSGSAGNLAVQTNTGSALTFTIMGFEA
jgi:hypothetical protein